MEVPWMCYSWLCCVYGVFEIRLWWGDKTILAMCHIRDIHTSYMTFTGVKIPTPSPTLNFLLSYQYEPSPTGTEYTATSEPGKCDLGLICVPFRTVLSLQFHMNLVRCFRTSLCWNTGFIHKIMSNKSWPAKTCSAIPDYCNYESFSK